MRAIFLTLIMLLTGCTTAQYGNFIKEDISNKHLVASTTAELIKLYPPAQTKFSVNQVVRDDFGLILIKTLRNSGYGISEKPSNQTNYKSLNYTLDKIDDFYRLTIKVDNSSLSRTFFNNGAASPWVYRR